MNNILVILMLLCVVGTCAGTACGLIIGALYADEILEFVLEAF